MKKKIFARMPSCLLPLAVFALCAFLCASSCVSPAPAAATVIIRGTVRITGNEPHTMAGISTEDGKSYGVFPAEKETAIRDLQGKIVDFTVIKNDPLAGGKNPFFRDGNVTVVSWKIVN